MSGGGMSRSPSSMNRSGGSQFAGQAGGGASSFGGFSSESRGGNAFAGGAGSRDAFNGAGSRDAFGGQGQFNGGFGDAGAQTPSALVHATLE